MWHYIYKGRLQYNEMGGGRNAQKRRFIGVLTPKYSPYLFYQYEGVAYCIYALVALSKQYTT